MLINGKNIYITKLQRKVKKQACFTIVLITLSILFHSILTLFRFLIDYGNSLSGYFIIFPYVRLALRITSGLTIRSLVLLRWSERRKETVHVRWFILWTWNKDIFYTLISNYHQIVLLNLTLRSVSLCNKPVTFNISRMTFQVCSLYFLRTIL